MTDQPIVALCVTCIVDQVMPEVGAATVRVLRRAGVKVSFPEQQTCCGQPFFNSGYWAEARAQAKHTITVFEHATHVVLPSGSCATMLRHEYPHLLADDPDWASRAEDLAHKTYELTEYLAEVCNWQPPTAPNPEPVTYHDSCHMCRALHLRKPPRQLLAQAGLTLNEMPESDRCCGFGGLFSVKIPEVSNAMTAQKLALATESGAKTLVTADPGCLMQMQGLADQSTLRLTHIAIVLDEASQ